MVAMVTTPCLQVIGSGARDDVEHEVVDARSIHVIVKVEAVVSTWVFLGVELSNLVAVTRGLQIDVVP